MSETTGILNWALLLFGLVGGIISIKQLADWLHEYRENRIDTFQSIERNAVKLIEKIQADGFNPQLVLGIGRSGALLGGWIAGNLGSIPIQVIDRAFKEEEGTTVEYPYATEIFAMLRRKYGEGTRVLVVEGASTTGSSLITFSKIRKQEVPDWNCRYAVLYEVESTRFPCQYVALHINRAPKRYPWHKTVHYASHLRSSKKLALL
jgi:hypoxanthine phosphoribosyltransferase